MTKFDQLCQLALSMDSLHHQKKRIVVEFPKFIDGNAYFFVGVSSKLLPNKDQMTYTGAYSLDLEGASETLIQMLSNVSVTRCLCGGEGTSEEHACPYNGDGTKRCNCCDECRFECLMDI